MPLDGFEAIDTGCPKSLQVKAVRFAAWLKWEKRKVGADSIIMQFKLRDKAQVRAMVGWLRVQGRPDLSRIASDDKGYWWEDDRAACLAGCEHLRQRARQIFRAYGGVEQAFEKVPGQKVLL